MNKKNVSQPKVSLPQKTALILLGLILSLVLLEGGLRLGGFVLLSLQECSNVRAIQQKGAYRILCLGESTTQGQYPYFLERALNQRNLGVRFSVIDKGIAGATTPAILSRVESFLDEYHPDMVVAMMGINDRGKHMPFEVPTTSKGTLFIRSFRIYKLARLLGLHLRTKAEGMKLHQTAEVGQSSEKIRTAPLRSVPQETSDEFISAEVAFKKALEIDPKSGHAYAGLGRLYQAQGEVSKAEDSFKKVIELDPQNDDAYVECGRIYQYQSKFSKAEDSFKKAIEIDPENDHAYAELGRLYLDQGEFSKAESSFKKALELDPQNDSAYVELGWLYQKQGKLSEAEALLKKALEINPENDRLWGAMSAICEEIGRPELGEAYAQRADRLRAYDHPMTMNNYRKLKEILDKRKIRLVCVQYPMRDAGPLKQLFAKDNGVIVVDNERVFKEALKNGSYKEYFRDMFAGDFGHCTPKGNGLLALNIAQVILREVFNTSLDQPMVF